MKRIAFLFMFLPCAVYSQTATPTYTAIPTPMKYAVYPCVSCTPAPGPQYLSKKGNFDGLNVHGPANIVGNLALQTVVVDTGQPVSNLIRADAFTGTDGTLLFWRGVLNNSCKLVNSEQDYGLELIADGFNLGSGSHVIYGNDTVGLFASSTLGWTFDINDGVTYDVYKVNSHEYMANQVVLSGTGGGATPTQIVERCQALPTATWDYRGRAGFDSTNERTLLLDYENGDVRFYKGTARGVPTPQTPTDAANKEYVDAVPTYAATAYVKKAGDSMSGPLTASGGVLSNSYQSADGYNVADFSPGFLLIGSTADGKRTFISGSHPTTTTAGIAIISTNPMDVDVDGGTNFITRQGEYNGYVAWRSIIDNEGTPVTMGVLRNVEETEGDFIGLQMYEGAGVSVTGGGDVQVDDVSLVALATRSYLEPTATHTFTVTPTFTVTATPNVATPSVVSKQKLSSAAYTWDEIRTYANSGVTCTVFMDPAGSGVSVVSGKVHAVTCGGSAGLTFIQATDGNRPLTATGPGGYMCLRNGAGVTQFLSSGAASISSVFSQTENTMFFVFKENTTKSINSGLLACDNTDGTNVVQIIADDAAGNIYYCYGDNNGATGRISKAYALSRGNYIVTSYCRNTSNVMGIYNNGVSIYSSIVLDTDGFTYSSGDTRGITIMASKYGAPRYLNGDLCALIILNGYLDPTGAEYIKIYNGIAQRFNLPTYPSTSNVIQEWVNSIGTWVAKVTDTGKLWLKGGADIIGAVIIRSINDADNVLTIIGTSLQTGDLLRLQGRGGGVTVAYNGGVTGTTAGFSGALNSASVSTTAVTVYRTNEVDRLFLQNIDNAGYMGISDQRLKVYRFNGSGGIFTVETGIISGSFSGSGGDIVIKPRATEVARFSGGGTTPLGLNLSAPLTGTTAGLSGNLTIGSAGNIVPLCTPTLVVPAAGITMQFKCGVCTGVNP